ncbi:MAG: HAMP domain-containing histidine kinase [Lachnospiraceae bacterium]|nr:HAMP domain-containing histidine kinase [Lachnospiraceae bacterium]
MGLSRKTFLYSVLLAAVMVAFITGYFVLMLPSLYVDYVMESDLKAVADAQRGYMEKGNYDGLTVKNPSVMYSLEFPYNGEEIRITGKFFAAALEIRDEELKEAMRRSLEILQGAEEGSETFGNAGDSGFFEFSEFCGDTEENAIVKMWEIVREKWREKEILPEDYPVRLHVETKQSQTAYSTGHSKVHFMTDGLMVYEWGVSDEDFSYTTYIAMGGREDALVFTVFPTMTPQMEEITPVVLGSLPMIALVVFLLVMAASRFFSGRIVNPIIRLAGCAERAGMTEDFTADFTAVSSGMNREDEIGALAKSLQELYEKLRGSYLELERKNDLLREDNLRQEVFLRATSHQLKTPVTAALLLVEGMIGEVGRYKNTREYLPEVKTQLLSMRKIVEDVLFLGYRAENRNVEEIAVEALAEETAAAYAPQAKEKSLRILVKGRAVLRTDGELLKKIMDNLFSNAVQYTPVGGRIEAEIADCGMCLRNYGAVIEESLLPHIFEPFVSSSGEKKGKGLGLYIAAYYSRLLGTTIRVENRGDHVQAMLIFGEKMKIEEDAEHADDQSTAGKIRGTDGAADHKANYI